MEQYHQRIHEYFALHREEMVETLMRLVRIPSVSRVQDAAEGAPYGEACAEVLRVCTELYEKEGFLAENKEKYVLATALNPDAPRSILLAAHADVVPADNRWTKCAPFEPLIEDGFLFGRGVRDDKAGVVASLFAAKCVKELELPVTAKLLLFTGASEETGMDDIHAFAEENPLPDLGLVPDSGFPAKRGETSRLFFDAVSQKPLTVLRRAEINPRRVNRILTEVTLYLADSDALYAGLDAVRGDNTALLRKDGEIVLQVLSAPKADGEPDTANDALLFALRLLASVDSADREAAQEMVAIIETGAGILISDAFGEKPLVHSSRLKIEDGRAELLLYARHWMRPPTAVLEKTAADYLEAHGWTYRRYSLNDGFFLDENDILVQSLLAEYERFTGSAGKSTVGHGGTYSRAFPKSVSVGTTVGGRAPDLPKGHGGMHAPDEYIEIDAFLAGCELITRMLLRENKLLEDHLC